MNSRCEVEREENDTSTGVVFKDTAAVVKTTFSIFNQPDSFAAARNGLSYYRLL